MIILTMMLIVSILLLANPSNGEMNNLEEAHELQIKQRQITNFVNILNIESLYIIIEEVSSQQSVRFVQTIKKQNMGIYYKTLNISQILEINVQDDKEFIFKQIIDNGHNERAVLSLIHLRPVMLFENITLIFNLNQQQHIRTSQSIAQQILLTQIYWFIRKSSEYKFFDFLRLSSIRSNDIIHVDLDQRKLTLTVSYDSSGYLNVGNMSFSNCQQFLLALDWALFDYLGFIHFKIHVTIQFLSDNISCVIFYPHIFVTIEIQEEFQVHTNLLKLYLYNFDIILIKNAIFQNRIMMLSSNKLFLNNIEIWDSYYFKFEQGKFIEFTNMIIKGKSSLLIDSENVTLVLENIQFLSMNVHNHSFIQLYGNIDRLIINQFFIRYSHLDNVFFITNKISEVQILLINFFEIFNSVISNVEFFPQSQVVYIRDCFLHDTIINQSQFIIADWIFISNSSYLNSSFQNTIIYRGNKLNLQSISFFNCSFIDAYIIRNSDLTIGQIKFSYLVLDQLEFSDINISQTIVENNYLIQIIADEVNITNILIEGQFQQFLYIDGRITNISHIKIQNIQSRQVLTQQTIHITSLLVILESIELSNIYIPYSSIIYLHANKITLTNAKFIQLVCHIHKGSVFEIHTAEVFMKNNHLLQSDQSSDQHCIFIVSISKIFKMQLFKIEYLENAKYLEFQIRSDKIMITEVNVKINSKQDSQRSAFTLIGKYVSISESIFIVINIKNIITSKCELQNYYNSTLSFINNYIKQEISLQNSTNFIEFLGYTNVFLSNNQFQILSSNTLASILIYSSSICQIINNVISKSGRILDIRQLDRYSTTSIRNLTLRNGQHESSLMNLNGIAITNGYIYQYKIRKIMLENILCYRHSSFKLLSFTNSESVYLSDIIVTQSTSFNLIDIQFQQSTILTNLDITIIFRNITIRKMSCKLMDLIDDNLIRFDGTEYSFISIKNLIINQVSCKSNSLKNFIQIRSKFQDISFENLILISIEARVQIITVQNQQQELQNKIKLSKMLLQNCTCDYLLQSNMPTVLINQSLIFLNNGTMIIQPEVASIEMSEIIYKDELSNSKQNLKLNLTALTFLRKDFIPQIRVSFDKGLKFAQNQELTRNFYKVIIKKYSDYIYIPNGQYLNNFQILDIRQLIYQQQNIIILYESNIQNLTNCSLTLKTGQIIYNKIKFNISNQNWDDLILTSKHGTIVEFIAQCMIPQFQIQTTLQFNAKIMNCQIGEVLLNDKCQACKISLQQFSVIKNSTVCKTIDEITMLKVDRGLIYLRKGFWRPYFSNIQIEQCQSVNNCIGGNDYGNNLCSSGSIGAVCSECDLFMQNSAQSYYKNQWSKCNVCDIDSISILSQLLSSIMYNYIYLLSSALLILNSVLAYRQLVKQNALIQAVYALHKIILKYQFDLLGIYIMLLLDYIQTLFNISRNQVLFLMPIQMNIDFLTNTSYSFITLFDCLFGAYFNLNQWPYIRLILVLISYILVLQIYLLILCLWLRKRKQKYQFLVISIAIIIIYQRNILGLFNQVLSLVSPINYSGLQWILGNRILSYNSKTHQTFLMYLLFPSTLIIAILLPIYLYFSIKVSKQYSQSFYYLKYLYQQPQNIQYIIQTSIQLILISQISLLERQQTIRLIFLTISLSIKYQYQYHHKPYILKRINDNYLQLQLWLNIQIMINGLMESNTTPFINYALSIGFYMIFISVLTNSLFRIINQLSQEYYLQFDKIRLIFSYILGRQFQLRQFRLQQIRNYFNIIKKAKLNRTSDSQI